MHTNNVTAICCMCAETGFVIDTVETLTTAKTICSATHCIVTSRKKNPALTYKQGSFITRVLSAASAATGDLHRGYVKNKTFVKHLQKSIIVLFCTFCFTLKYCENVAKHYKTFLQM